MPPRPADGLPASGIAQRAFEHRFQLADHVKVTGANLVNGLLDIELVREVPESVKPQKITIGQATVEKPQRDRARERTGGVSGRDLADEWRVPGRMIGPAPSCFGIPVAGRGRAEARPQVAKGRRLFRPRALG